MYGKVIGILRVAVLVSLISCLSPMVLLATDWPKDPPVDTGGEGGSGNDWDDFPVGQREVHYIRSSTPTYALTEGVRIAANNPNFDSDHCRTSAETDYKVSHIHAELDYASDFGAPHGTVTAVEGKAFWDDAYDGYESILDANYYTPVSGGTGPTTAKNCIAHALHNYNSDLTKATSWVNPADAQPYFSELTLISSQGNHSVLDGDRLASSGYAHAWIVIEAGANDQALDVEWKNGESGIYRWDHLPLCSNACPEGNVGKSLISAAGIYRRIEEE